MKTPRKGDFYQVRCACCKQISITAYDVAALHDAAKKFQWAWIGEHAVCHRCLIADDAKTARIIRELQGDYGRLELTDHVQE